MKPFLRRLAAALLGIVVVAGFTTSNAVTLPLEPQQAAGSVATPGGDRLTPSELEELLGSIALYPDPLLANVLAASVYPDEVAEAAKFAATKPAKDQIKAKTWEDPVKAVTEFPDVIKMMGDYPDWTVALGQAYLTQAKDVMDVVQSLRKKANDNGALVTTPEQKVVVEKEVVYIQPADPEVIYVPSYTPSVVYVDHHDDDWVAGALGFGLGITAGLIIGNNMDCDWHGGCVGWGGGWGGGHNDVDVDINGDVNIGNRETNVSRGDRNTNVSGGDRTVKGGDRTNVQGGNRNASQNRVGNEGNAWAPNKSKSLATSKPSQTGNLKSGASNRMSTPGGGSRTGGAGGANRPSGGANRASGGAKPAQQPAGRSGGAGAKPSQKPAGGSRVPQSRPPAASSSQRGSAYGGGSNTRADSQRGASSRSSSASRSSSSSRSSGGSRSGGGGSRGGGGGGRGGGGRR